MLEFKKRVLEFKFEDKVCRVDYPSVRQLNEYSKEFEKEEDKLSMLVNFLVKLGLEKEVCDELEIDHLQKIIATISTQKKS